MSCKINPLSTLCKVRKCEVLSGLCFLFPGLNTKIYREHFRLQSKYEKIQTRKIFNYTTNIYLCDKCFACVVLEVLYDVLFWRFQHLKNCILQVKLLWSFSALLIWYDKLLRIQINYLDFQEDNSLSWNQLHSSIL